jgi:predicted metal-binding membrane protein
MMTKVKGGRILDRVMRHERLIMAFGLLTIILLSWAYLLSGAGTMQEMGDMLMPMSAWPWSVEHATLMFVMWLVMMAAMMLPSAAPVILLYTTIARRSEPGTLAPSAPALFVLGYLIIWGGFSLAAVLTQFFLEWSTFLSPMMESNSVVLSGILLIGAGIYQFMPLKRSCLRLCRSPLDFLTSHWRSGNRGAFMMGVRHGIYCLGCCWGLMLLLFVGGVMNLVWIAALAVFILIEKLAPGGEWLGRAAGVPLIAIGIALLLTPLM